VGRGMKVVLISIIKSRGKKRTRGGKKMAAMKNKEMR
jgi:hypothetical protein